MALLLIELAILVLFSVVALVKVYAGDISGSIHPSLSWLTPTNFGGISNLADGLLVAVFIYWGWDTATSVNEECKDSSRIPGIAGVLSTIILLGIFIVVSFAAQAVKGAGYLTNHSDDVLSSTGHIVFGSSGWGDVALKLLIIAVLSSAAASCQTTILPAARTSLSMALHRAFPPKFGEVNPRHLTPAFATWVFGIGSSLWYLLLVVLAHISGGDVLGWSIASVGLMIAYYYGQTGIACVIYFRRYLFKSVRNFFLVGVLPLAGGLILAFIFAWSLKDMTDPAFTDPAVSWLGFNPVFFIGLGTLLAGFPLMFWWNRHDGAFFRVKTDPMDRRPPPEGGNPLPPLVSAGAER